jgi:hypothetical protein
MWLAQGILLSMIITTTQKINNIWSEEISEISKPGGLDLSRRDLDRDLDLDAQKVSVSTVEKISTVFKS